MPTVLPIISIEDEKLQYQEIMKKAKKKEKRNKQTKRKKKKDKTNPPKKFSASIPICCQNIDKSNLHLQGE